MPAAKQQAAGAAKGTAEAAPKAKKSKTPKASTPHKDMSVKLGQIAPNGISPSMFGLIERGVAKRPRVARALQGKLELRFKEDFAPVRVTFKPGEILVEDGLPPAKGERRFKPDLVISGSLPQIVQLAAAPLFGALATVAGGKVKIEGSPMLARRVMKLLEI